MSLGGWTVSDISNVALLIVTILVSIFGVYQFVATTRFNRNQAAKAIHAEYIKLALDKPLLANPAVGKIDFEKLTVDGNREEFERYEWFVSYMLLSFEEIFHLSNEDAWSSTLRSNLKVHKAYFKSQHFKESGYLDNIDAPIRALINEITKSSKKP